MASMCVQVIKPGGQPNQGDLPVTGIARWMKSSVLKNPHTSV